jgi:hypothetical protein
LPKATIKIMAPTMTTAMMIHLPVWLNLFILQ